jgi:hypothetical protein
VHPVLDADRRLGLGPGRDVVATLAVDRDLKNGALDTVELTEAGLANLVAEGATLLARLAGERER